ncbi:MAG TPA: hypothetical protein PK899_09400 [Spirochaetota bacterium]|nr:hypothetical protein [Spirochaetota bacterium]
MELNISIDVAVIIFIIVIMKFVIKKLIKKTEVYPIIVFAIATIISAIYGFIYRDGDFFKLLFEKCFFWGAGSISLYDVIIEKIEGFFEARKNAKKYN